MSIEQKQDLIRYIWELEDQWEALNQPQVGFMGNVTFRRLNDTDLEKSVLITRKEQRMKRALRKEIGLLGYIRYAINPLAYYKNYK